MCKFITDLFFTNVGLVLTVCLRAKQIIHFRNDTERNCLNYYVVFQDSSLSPTFEHMPNFDLWVYDQELGLYWLNRVEAPLFNQIPCSSLICTASVTSSAGIVPLTLSFASF